MADTQPLAPTDAELLSLNEGEVYFSESPSKFPEIHGTQYHAGAPGVLDFARAVLAKWGAQPVPAGYALVPVEPTEDMFIDGMEADCCGRPSIDDDRHVRSIWAAMIAAAPQPVEREPLTRQQLREAFHKDTGCTLGGDIDLAERVCGVVERAHGIA